MESPTDRQQRGADCLVCGQILRPGHVVDLGPRRVDAHGTGALWFPRRHPGCTSEHVAAFRAVLDHTVHCPTCLEGCATGDEPRRAEKAARP